jgi:hypothetical protein
LSLLSDYLFSISSLLYLLLFVLLSLSLFFFLLVFLLFLLGLLVLDFFLKLFRVDLLLLVVLLFTVSVLFELSNEETVHVVDMWVDPPSQVEARVETLFFVLGEARHADFVRDAELNQFNMASTEGVVNYPFVLFNCNGASRITIRI